MSMRICSIYNTMAVTVQPRVHIEHVGTFLFFVLGLSITDT